MRQLSSCIWCRSSRSACGLPDIAAATLNNGGWATKSMRERAWQRPFQFLCKSPLHNCAREQKVGVPIATNFTLQNLANWRRLNSPLLPSDYNDFLPFPSEVQLRQLLAAFGVNSMGRKRKKIPSNKVRSWRKWRKCTRSRLGKKRYFGIPGRGRKVSLGQQTEVSGFSRQIL